MGMHDQICDTAAALIKERGFHGFSFQDISERVGIKKASIHYHFPSKSDLGVAVLSSYRRAMRAAAIRAAEQPEPLDHWQALTDFLTPIMAFGRTGSDICLCGALGGEYPSLPPEMQTEVAAFFDEHLAWLTWLLTDGRAAGTFHFTSAPETLARFILAAIEGAMLIKRTSGNLEYVDEVAKMAASLLRQS
jgi:TetR/AcrR family transcriptional regulator, transcriptional repressor for nem operon